MFSQKQLQYFNAFAVKPIYKKYLLTLSFKVKMASGLLNVNEDEKRRTVWCNTNSHRQVAVLAGEMREYAEEEMRKYPPMSTLES